MGPIKQGGIESRGFPIVGAPIDALTQDVELGRSNGVDEVAEREGPETTHGGPEEEAAGVRRDDALELAAEWTRRREWR